MPFSTDPLNDPLDDPLTGELSFDSPFSTFPLVSDFESGSEKSEGLKSSHLSYPKFTNDKTLAVIGTKFSRSKFGLL